MSEPFQIQDYDMRLIWTRVVWRHTKLMDGSKVVANVLADHLNMDTGQLNPSLATIADKSGRQARAIGKAIADLKNHWLLGSVPGSGRTSSSYRLILPTESGTAVPLCVAHTYHAARHVLTAWVAQKGKKGGMGVPPNLLRTYGITLGPAAARDPSGAPAPPDGATVAARFGEAGPKLLQKAGPAVVAAWLSKISLRDGVLIAPSDMYANYLRRDLADVMDFAFGPGKWPIRVERDHAAA